MLTIFCGFDDRESLGTYVFMSSVLHRASIPVSFVPLRLRDVKIGTNQFTLSRFLVPYLCGYKGKVVFCDAADMICLEDVAEFRTMLDEMTTAVSVVKHNYLTKNPVKYIGTEMESPNLNYERKNWASMMLINCEHPAWKTITPQAIDTFKMLDLLQFRFLADSEIGDVPNEWNRMVDEDQPLGGAKIVHWTAGIPAFKHYHNAVGADLWRIECARSTYPLLTQ